MTTQQPIFDAIYGYLTTAWFTLTESQWESMGETPWVSLSETTLAGGRIYDSLPPQDVAFPLIIVSMISDVPQYYFDSDDIRPDFQVDVYNKLEAGPKATRVIADQVYGFLNRGSLTITGYSGCQTICLDRGGNYDQELIVGSRTQQDSGRISQSYRIFGSNDTGS